MYYGPNNSRSVTSAGVVIKVNPLPPPTPPSPSPPLTVSVTLNASMLPTGFSAVISTTSNAPNFSIVSVSSSNESVAKIVFNNKHVQAVGVGSAIISVTVSANGVTKTGTAELAVVDSDDKLVPEKMGLSASTEMTIYQAQQEIKTYRMTMFGESYLESVAWAGQWASELMKCNYNLAINFFLAVPAYSNNTPLPAAQMIVNAEFIFNYLRAKGWSVNAICAVLGNMVIESTINPGYKQRGGNGFGLIQWDDRKDTLLNWLQTNGYADGSIVGQLEFMIYEMQSKYGPWLEDKKRGYYMDVNEFITSTDLNIENLTTVFQYSDERGGYGTESARQYNARQFYNYFTKGTPLQLQDQYGRLYK